MNKANPSFAATLSMSVGEPPVSKSILQTSFGSNHAVGSPETSTSHLYFGNAATRSMGGAAKPGLGWMLAALKSDAQSGV